MKKVLFFNLFLIICCISFPQVKKERIISKNKILYASNTVVVKLKNAGIYPMKSSSSWKINSILDALNVHSSEIMFPGSGQISGLNKIIIINYSADEDPFEVSARLSKLGEVEWAEPRYVYETYAINPNDPMYVFQSNLALIDAEAAWDISTGSRDIVIGIIDSGVDWDHPDLAANIWSNPREIPDNGSDDDNNGYPDDIRGWDFGGLTGTSDNNPMEDSAYHGTHVAGIASAVGGNNTGIASIGFGSALMPVKVARDDIRGSDNTPVIFYGYEGIRYAADNGAKIINCSWGGPGYSFLGQEVINDALSKGALIIAAAGNDGESAPAYPASYDGVLSVGWTNDNDVRNFFSNYGYFIDVTAPGSSVWSTWMNDTYKQASGTSMSSPLAAGLAALVAARFPHYTPMQIGEQVRVTSDDIYDLNPAYQFQIGKGRINAFNALNNVNAVSVRAVEVIFSDEAPGGNGDNIFMPGETISISASFINYLNPSTALLITLESLNSNAAVQNGTFNAGVKSSLERFSSPAKFTVTLGNDLPFNSNLTFILRFNDGDYSDYQVISTFANPSYADHSGNDISLTITAKGTLGFNDYPENQQGSGFVYRGSPNLLFEGALIIGSSVSRISDAARSAANDQNEDFELVEPFRVSPENGVNHGSAQFDDSRGGASRFNINVILDSYTFSSDSGGNYIMLNYGIVNNSGDIISNIYTGLFFDWDLSESADDLISYDMPGNFGYVLSGAGENLPLVGSAVISRGSYGFWGIYNGGGDGGFSIYDGFSDAEKFQTLASGLGKMQAGPGDVSFVVSTGPFNIAPSDTLNTAFAVAAGSDINEVRTAVLNARIKYKELIKDTSSGGEQPDKFALFQNYPNPFNPNTTIKYSLPAAGHVLLKVYDMLGNEIRTLVNELKTGGVHLTEFGTEGLSSGVYFYRIESGSFSEVKKMIILK